jgi:hypothetical protein
MSTELHQDLMPRQSLAPGKEAVFARKNSVIRILLDQFNRPRPRLNLENPKAAHISAAMLMA